MMATGNILLVDDEEKLRALLSRIIRLEGYTVFEASTLKAGMKTLEKENIDVLLCDVKLPDGTGIDFVSQVKLKFPCTEIILLTAYGNIADGVQAMKNGAFDYITKGDDNERILPLVNKAIDKAALQFRVFELEQKLIKRYSFDTILGTSKIIQQAKDLAKKVSVTDTTVLLLGETGTGKEVFAQAIHYNSKRANKNFVALNCSAFSAELLESELFGYKAGAFTSAVKDKKGLVEEADGGTLFLDEIGEMNIDLQAKLLRVLEAGEFIKLGQTKTQKVNIRVIAATNRNLEEAIELGHFRRDLFYRLSIFSITLPSLNHRTDDIPLLAKHYLREYSLKAGKQIKGMDNAFTKMLESHNWKGNIRELKNMIERAVIIADADTLTTNLLPFDFSSQEAVNAGIFELSAIEKQHIIRVLKFTAGNKTEASRLLGIGLTTLYRKIEEYHLI